MAAEEPVAAAVEQSDAVPAKERKAKATKEAKVRKPAVPRKLRSPSAHPPYVEMVGEAIAALKERTGSSQYAIGKFIEDKHGARLPPNFKKLLLVQLRKLTTSGKLTKIKSSYKLSGKPKPAAAAAAVKPKPKPAAATKPKPKPAAAKPKPKPATSAKSVPKTAVAAKPKPKPKPAVKAKAATKVARPKPKARPAKASKTSAKDSPGKKAAVVVPKKKAAAAAAAAAGPAVKKPKSVRSVVKASAKKAAPKMTAARKGKK